MAKELHSIPPTDYVTDLLRSYGDFTSLLAPKEFILLLSGGYDHDGRPTNYYEKAFTADSVSQTEHGLMLQRNGKTIASFSWSAVGGFYEKGIEKS